MTMRNLIFLCLVLACGGCQTSAATSAAVADEPEPPSSERREFLDGEEFSTRYARLVELEKQALQLAVDEPLKLGSIGSAILDLYPRSQTGHYVMSRFYEHVESADARSRHEAELAAIQNEMRASGDGTRIAPFQIMTVHDAQTYALTQDTSPVGAIYQSYDTADFGYLLVARPAAAPLQQTFFDLSHLLQSLPGHSDTEAPNAWTYIRVLATVNMDSAAQTAVGAYLASTQKYEDAIDWLRVAARADNVLANAMLARIYWTLSEQSEEEEEIDELRELSLENHLHAIALGSTESMYTLANLYLNDIYGEENRAAGVPLLRQAGDLNHVESLIYLGHLHNTGDNVKRDPTQASLYFERAAAMDSPLAVLSQGRFLVGLPVEDHGSVNLEDSAVHTRLEVLADDDSAEAMVILGNLHARGVGTRPSTSRAFRWYKRAVNQAPDDADIVNEVAWTLTVTDVDGMQRARYAKRIMDSLMENSEPARERPEYLDTWAAIYAANGDFERAIELQEQAIAAATSQQRDDVMDILLDHLEQFKSGGTITEKAP